MHLINRHESEQLTSGRALYRNYMEHIIYKVAYVTSNITWWIVTNGIIYTVLELELVPSQIGKV